MPRFDGYPSAESVEGFCNRQPFGALLGHQLQVFVRQRIEHASIVNMARRAIDIPAEKLAFKRRYCAASRSPVFKTEIQE